MKRDITTTKRHAHKTEASFTSFLSHYFPTIGTGTKKTSHFHSPSALATPSNSSSTKESLPAARRPVLMRITDASENKGEKTCYEAINSKNGANNLLPVPVR